MPLDARVKRFLDLLAAGGGQKQTRANLAQRRANLVELMKLAGPEVPVARITDVTVAAARGRSADHRSADHRNADHRSADHRIPARIYTPVSPDATLPGLLYFHGGGLVAGSVASHEAIARALAHSGACRVVSVDYRLAPEHPFPAALEDAFAATEYVLEHALELGIDPERLGICGDSAGATLAAATCQAFARAGGRPKLALQVLLCPILDFSARSQSRRQMGEGYLVEEATIAEDFAHYAPAGTDPSDPRLSPLRAAEMTGLPKTIIHTAEFDPFRDEAREYFSRLTQVSAAHSYTCHAGMIHLFYGLGAVIPYAQPALEQIGREIRGAFKLMEAS